MLLFFPHYTEKIKNQRRASDAAHTCRDMPARLIFGLRSARSLAPGALGLIKSRNHGCESVSRSLGIPRTAAAAIHPCSSIMVSLDATT